MGLAVLIGMLAIYSIYLYSTTGEQKHIYFLGGYLILILFVLRGKFIRK